MYKNQKDQEEYLKKYRINNIEKIKQQEKNWYQNNKEKKIAYSKLRREKIKNGTWNFDKKPTEKDYEKRYDNNKEIQWEKDIKEKYNVDSDWYYNKIKEQNNCCAICKTNKPGTRLNKFCVDHYDTENGPIVRGLLCFDCNTAIGKLKHKIELLIESIKYLKG